MLTTDEYGHQRTVAPEGKVLKGYLVDALGLIEHCLVDQWGLVFVSGGIGGWSNRQGSPHTRLVVFPNAVERGNELNNRSWRWEDWYEQNWLCDSWAWMYMKAAKLCEIGNV